MTIALQVPPPLPPDCREHPGFQPGCPHCQEYKRACKARRTRLRAYGRWQPWVDPGPVVEHTQRLIVAGISARRIAAVCQISSRTVSNICRNRSQRIRVNVAQRILALPVPHEGSAVGTTRRLQALARLGYGVADLAPHWTALGGADPHNKLSQLRLGRRIHYAYEEHRRVYQLYELLWAEEGPSSLVSQFAEKRGWLHPDAWTEATIDDPNAEPYSDAAALEYTDEVKLAKARLPHGDPNRVPFTDLTPAEQAVLYWEHLRRSSSSRMFAARYRPMKPTKEVSEAWRLAFRRLRAEYGDGTGD